MVSSQSTNQVRFIWLETDLLFLLRWWRSWTHQEWRGKIAINLHEKMEKWKLNRDSRCFDSFVTTLPLFLDKVTFRVISTSISPQEIWLLIPRRNSQARNSEFWRKILTFSSGLLLFYFLFFFSRTIGEESLLDWPNCLSHIENRWLVQLAYPLFEIFFLGLALFLG